MMHLLYLKYVILHKWYVLLESRRFKVPFLYALLHDWDKFLPSHWYAYARYFYWPKYSIIPELKKIEKEKFLIDFDRAWNNHQKLNRHHWQYWIFIYDSGEVKILEMPENDVREMLADWAGVSRVLGGNPKDWYENNKRKMMLHHRTRVVVEDLLQQHYG